ncbi:MAG: TrkH family potassium uptake protein [Lachnospiraceae bacterium]|nr:TrkH family potassium uptake protein [Lachnospiraceae bacterium]MBP5565223.1 TrkH family potassium uptake protein [Lachnospiraceae bacterium]
MNIAVIIYTLGRVIAIEAAFMALPGIVALIYRENVWWAYFLVALLGMLLGLLVSIKKPKNMQFFAKEGFATVGLSWFLMSLVGALPLFISREIPNYIDAVFEMSSGFTTTGATILTSVEDMSHAANFWRCFSHWIGGMGIIVFLLAVLPMAGSVNMHLLRAESPGPVVGKLVPKMKDSSQILYLIYFALTVFQIVSLIILGMNPYEAICTAVATAGTGGFGVYNDSIASFSTPIKWDVTIFMILFGINFNVYFLLLARKFKAIFKIEEVRAYLGMILLSVIIITLSIFRTYAKFGEALTDAAFQVGSIITTTGFATCDFNEWPSLPKTILIVLMITGACAGSTGGGLKFSRILIGLKAVKQEINSFIHPRSVKTVEMDDRALDKNVVKSVCVYFVLFALIYFGSVFIVSIDKYDMVTDFTAVLATMNNIGPGLNAVGPSGNFAGFNYLSKIVFIFDMLAGRLELYPILLLFAPPMWKKH